MLRTHWSERRRQGKVWERLIWTERCQHHVGAFPAFLRAHVAIQRQSPKLLDVDNLHGAIKVVLDALRANLIIEDDSPEHITLKVSQLRGTAQTTIHVVRK
jgi:hypothetical protein